MSRPPSKFVIVLAGGLVFVALAMVAPRHDFVSLSCLGLMIGIALVPLWQVSGLVDRGLTALGKRVSTAVKAVRTFMQVSPEVQVIHVAAWSCGCFAGALQLAGLRMAASVGIVLCVALLVVAGVIDLAQRVGPLLRLVWQGIFGKVFAVSIGAALLGFAVVLSKRWIHSVTHVDPKYLSEAIAIVSALLLPVVYAVCGMAVLGLFGMGQMLGSVLMSWFAHFVQLFAPLLGRRNSGKLDQFWAATAPPACAGNGIQMSRKFNFLDGISHFSKGWSTFAIVAVFAFGLDSVIAGLKEVQPHLISALVQLEYRSASKCFGLERASGIVYMEDSYISVAWPRGETFEFTVEKCELDAEAATAE